MKTTPEARKVQLIAGLIAARNEIIAAIAARAPEDRDAVFLGAWSAHDIAAHLIGWDAANLEAVDAILAGRLPAFYQHYDAARLAFTSEGTSSEALASLMS